MENIAYVGDDINDMEVICNVGLGCCVSDAVECVKNGADIPVVYFTDLLAEALGVKEDTNGK